MKLNAPEQSMLGGGAAQRLAIPRYDYYERQWRTQRGTWGDVGVADRLSDDVGSVVDVFRTKGASAGLLAAKQRGILEAARLYLLVRADTEEELAARLAKLRAALAVRPILGDKLREAFLVARLEEVRRAVAANHTPPQAIADKPEIPRRQIPRWVPVAALVLSAIALLRSLR